MAGLTADELVARVRRTAALPTADDYTDAEILQIADEHIKTLFIPGIQRQMEEYYLRSINIALVANQSNYRLPERTIGAAFRGVYLKGQSSNTDDDLFELPKYTLESFYQETNTSIGGTPSYYTLVGDLVRIRPIPSSSDTTAMLTIFYNRRPSELILTSAAMKISSLTGAPAYPVDDAFSNGNYSVDVVQSNPNFDSLGDDLNVTVSGGTTATFSEAITDLKVGDYICLSGQSPVPQIPTELHPALAYSVASHILEERGDLTAADRWMSRATGLLENMETLLSPRVHGAVDKLQPRHGLFRQRGYRRGRYARGY